MSKNKLEWQTEKRKINDLIPYDKNPRSLSEKQLSDLKKSLNRFNLVEIPAIDLDNKIIAGHQRLKVLQLLGRGEEIIDVRLPNRKMTQKEYDQYLITSNSVTGDWDFEKLKSFDIDMILDVGFDEIDLAKFWDNDIRTKDDNFDVDKEIKKAYDTTIKTGDIIILGRHRIICGDSTDPENLKRLFDGEKASMIYSDPIYNIGVDYNRGIGGKQNYGGNVRDNRSDMDYKNLLSKSLSCGLSVSKEDTHVFYYCDQIYIGMVQDVYRENNVKNKRVCLWLKNGHNPTPNSPFNKCYEPCVYGSRNSPYIAKDIQNLNEVMNKDIGTGNEMLDQVDIWMAKRISSKDYSHATSKPVDLHEKAIRRCTKLNDIILDSFLGSGSTLIAAEMLKRRVFGCEKEPVFCELIKNRFEKLTGIKAEIIHNEEK